METWLLQAALQYRPAELRVLSRKLTWQGMFRHIFIRGHSPAAVTWDRAANSDPNAPGTPCCDGTSSLPLWVTTATSGYSEAARRR